MYTIHFSKAYKKSVKKFVKNGDIKLPEIDVVVDLISQGKSLPSQYRDHKLNGEFSAYRECHIRGDLLLVYQIIKKELVLIVIDIGTHSEIF